MRKSKDKFTDWSDSVGNHRDRKEMDYLKQSTADKDQIRHVTGMEVIRWK